MEIFEIKKDPNIKPIWIFVEDFDLTNKVARRIMQFIVEAVDKEKKLANDNCLLYLCYLFLYTLLYIT